MKNERRRALLRTIGLTGMAALAGCQRSADGDASTATTTPTATSTTVDATTTETTVSFDLDTNGSTGESASLLTVTGEVSSNKPLQSVVVSAGEAQTSIDASDRTDVSLNTTLRVDGGQRYDVTVTAVDENDGTAATTLRTGHVPIHADPIDASRLVGAHYYPWYEAYGNHSNWTDRTVSTPVLGEYSATDREVVDQHLKWCLEHGIHWLSVSWWGPQSATDAVLNETLTEMARFDDLAFSVLYETKGRFEEWDYDLDVPAARERLARDFQYLDDEYWGRDNYHRIDASPVVYFYISNHFSGDVAAAFENATASIDADPYVLAGVPFGAAPDTYPIMSVADGVTSYNPYSAREDIESVFHDTYPRGNKILEVGAEVAGVDYTPVVIPGYDDTGLPDAIREDNPVLSASPERFERVCRQVNPHLEDAEGVLVTSFNEWYENTQVEPGEQHGTRYLELVASELATSTSRGFETEGTVFRLDFNRTFVPDSGDDRQLAFMAWRLAFYDGDEEIAAFDIGDPADEPLFLKGVFGASSNEDGSWRWFGGYDAEAVLYVEGGIARANRAVFTGVPMRSNKITATVYVDGERTDQVSFGARDGPDEYSLSLD